LRNIEASFSQSYERDHIMDFVRKSERGIIKGLLDD
jgi:hypothetical protein